jgi:hypothetical protein
MTTLEDMIAKAVAAEMERQRQLAVIAARAREERITRENVHFQNRFMRELDALYPFVEEFVHPETHEGVLSTGPAALLGAYKGLERVEINQYGQSWRVVVASESGQYGNVLAIEGDGETVDRILLAISQMAKAYEMSKHHEEV